MEVRTLWEVSRTARKGLTSAETQNSHQSYKYQGQLHGAGGKAVWPDRLSSERDVGALVFIAERCIAAIRAAGTECIIS